MSEDLAIEFVQTLSHEDLVKVIVNTEDNPKYIFLNLAAKDQLTFLLLSEIDND